MEYVAIYLWFSVAVTMLIEWPEEEREGVVTILVVAFWPILILLLILQEPRK